MPSVPHRLGDRHHLVVDCDTGLLLRHEARIGNSPFQVDELAAVTVNEPIAPSRFEFAKP